MRKLTLAQLSEYTRIDTSYISKMEIGDRGATLKHLRVIAKHLGCTAGDLLNAEDNPTSVSNDEMKILQTMRKDKYAAYLIKELAESVDQFHQQK